MHLSMGPTWQQALAPTFTLPAFQSLAMAVDTAYATELVYPPQPDLFAAFASTPLPHVKVVILGQDPYHGAGQAHGLAFSVPDGIPLPPSLKNIYREITADIGTPAPPSGNLARLATQGVLLLNSTLTVRAGTPQSHHTLGWETFTDSVISAISTNRAHVVFLLWGAFALTKRRLIDESQHLVLTAPHPSPLSAYRGFLGCRHFSQCNTYLRTHGEVPIIW